MAAPAQISICIPTWNGARHLAETLESATRQDMEGLEIIVCDDASDDRTLEIAHSRPDPRMQLLRNDRRLGIPGNWIRAIGAASADRILLLLQDDLLVPTAVRTLSSTLDACPEATLAFGRRHIAYEYSGRVSEFLLKGTYPQVQEAFYRSASAPVHGLDLVRRTLAHGGDLTMNVVGEPSFALMRRDAMERAGGFDRRLRQLVDWEFWLRMAKVGPLAFVDETVGTFRVHDTGQSAQVQGTPRIPLDCLRVLRSIRRTYGSDLTAPERRALRRSAWRAWRQLVGDSLAWTARRAVGFDLSQARR